MIHLRNCILTLLCLLTGTAFATNTKFRAAEQAEAHEGRYLVTIARDADLDIAVGALLRAYGGRVEPYAAAEFHGFLLVALPARARSLSADPRVELVEEIARETEAPPPPVSRDSSSPRVQPRSEWVATDALWSSGVYKYDGAGNIKKIGEDEYRYDGLGRLVSATATTNRANAQAYAYDVYGNLTRVTTTSATETRTTMFAVDPQTNRLKLGSCSDPAAVCMQGIYDAAGNQWVR